ncbi:hypothetical protein ABZ511_24065 [Nocardia gamkensis]|uniref:hypothetical protein n=1 Tax=Nocardia gamkensis TaxID=352869 RepID=UPI0033DA2552
MRREQMAWTGLAATAVTADSYGGDGVGLARPSPHPCDGLVRPLGGGLLDRVGAKWGSGPDPRSARRNADRVEVTPDP